MKIFIAPKGTSKRRSMSDGLRIFLVDDEVHMLEALGDILISRGHAVSTATGGSEALEKLRGSVPFDLIIADLRMPGMDGVELLERVREVCPWTMFVMLTGYGTIKSAIEATKKGAYEYILKPFNPDEILQIVNRIVERKNLWENNIYFREELSKNYHFDNIVGKAPAMQAIFERIKTIAPTNSSVLLAGESGTGKELLAHVIHYASPRRNKPFIKVSCASLPDGVLESELFGHEKGALLLLSPRGKAGLSWLIREPCFWIRSATSPFPPRQNCSAFCRLWSLKEWAGQRPSRWMSDSSQRAIRIWKRSSERRDFGRICSIV